MLHVTQTNTNAEGPSDAGEVKKNEEPKKKVSLLSLNYSNHRKNFDTVYLLE